MTVKERILAERAKRDKQKAIQESRQRAARVRNTRAPLTEGTRPATRPTVAKRPLRENTAAPVRRATVLTENVKKRSTNLITESINQRNRALKLNKSETLVYDMLANNIVKATNALTEATQAGPNVHGVSDNQAGVGLVTTFFDIFYGFFPDLITPLIASVQPLPTQDGYYFYMQYTAGSDKGAVKKGDIFIDPFQINTPQEYTSNIVGLKDLVAGETSYSVTAALWDPAKPQGVSIEGAELVWSNATDFVGEIHGEAITAGKVTLTDTTIKVDFTVANALEENVKVAYAYDNVFVPTEVPELTANVVKRPIKAQYRTIKTNYAFAAAFGYEAEHKANLPEKLAEAAMFELRREIDLEAVFKIMSAAPTKVVWNKAAGFAVGAYENHKLSFMDALGQAANQIYKKSKRVRGNVLIAGIEVLTLIETLPKWKGTEFGKDVDGAGVRGTLGSMPVIIVPELGDNEFAVIYKGQKDNFDAGLVFAPYIPVFATDPITTDDFEIKRAYITAYALEVVNPDYFVRGQIINDPVALPVFLMSKDGTEGNLGTANEENLSIFA